MHLKSARVTGALEACGCVGLLSNLHKAAECIDIDR